MEVKNKNKIKIFTLEGDRVLGILHGVDSNCKGIGLLRPLHAVVLLNPGPWNDGGLGPCWGGQMNLQKPRTARVRAIPEDLVMEFEVMAG